MNHTREFKELSKRLAFRTEVDRRYCSEEQCWKCCYTVFAGRKDINRHISLHHSDLVHEAATELAKTYGSCKELKLSTKKFKSQCATPKPVPYDNQFDVPVLDERTVCALLPQSPGHSPVDVSTYKVILFYKYVTIPDTDYICSWQSLLCRRLHLNGKVRVSREGLNVTVSGAEDNINTYISAIRSFHLFDDLRDEDFKVSWSKIDPFSGGLKVAVHEEAVPMGVSPDCLSAREGGKHLGAQAFHDIVKEVKDKVSQDNVIIDCRNFYESKIGSFEGAVQPDIRKFSDWPRYVDDNLELFSGKNIYMFCTGGIRCERGSAYLRQKGVENVFQLEGGIHKYMEEIPEQDHLFRGKLFVFDDRYSIFGENEVVSSCIYCDRPWDAYAPCSSRHCHQLVLSCSKCRDVGLTACCRTCQAHHDAGVTREQCECTDKRASQHRVTAHDAGTAPVTSYQHTGMDR